MVNSDFQRRLYCMLGALLLVCTLSAITAIGALTVGNDSRLTAQRAAADAASIDAIQLRVARVAAAAERVVVTGEGLDRLTEARADLAKVRASLEAMVDDNSLRGEAAALTRDVSDLERAVDRATGVMAPQGIAAFVEYRALLEPIRDALDADAKEVAQRLATQHDDAAAHSDVVVAHARWTLAVTALVGFGLAGAIAVGAARDLRVRRGFVRAAAVV